MTDTTSADRVGSGSPARGYSWPPFTEGNKAAVTHGARSPELIGVEAAAILEELAHLAPPWLSEIDQYELRAWAFHEGACQRLRRWLLKNGELDAAGNPRHANKLLLSHERQAAACRKQIGFNPLARAQLARDRAAAGLFTVQGQRLAGADVLVEEGQALAQERLAALPASEPDGEDER